ncbi:hypothetical protein [Mycolicibacterium sarraceniae]|nr:hypothetical protein [Mycolicibacterium sarraceniae]
MARYAPAIDVVAADFPDLTVVMAHPAVARKIRTENALRVLGLA